MITALKHWWQQLSQREQVIVGSGAAVVAVLLIYAFLWAPFSNDMINYQQNIVNQRDLYGWMKTAAQRINQLKTEGYTVSQQRRGSVLVITEQSLASHKLSSYVKQVQQPQSNQIQLTLNNVPFDRFIRFAQDIWKSAALQVQQIKVDRGNTTGVVTVDVVFAR